MCYWVLTLASPSYRFAMLEGWVSRFSRESLQQILLLAAGFHTLSRLCHWGVVAVYIAHGWRHP